MCYYCEIKDDPELTEDQVKAIEQEQEEYERDGEDEERE